MARSSGLTGGLSDLFKNIDPYGQKEGMPLQAPKQEKLHLETILPDAGQPRQLLPAALMAQLSSGQQAAVTILDTWLREAPQGSPAQAKAAADLQQLANTIAQHGLINPITVRAVTAEDEVPGGIDYMIVAGERRWWAHVLLTLQDRTVGPAQAQPDRIAATIVSEDVNVRAVQLIENIAREDLSALERAHGIEALREDLARLTGEAVTWKRVEEVLGISKSYRIRILRVLRLSSAAQALVQAHNLPERAIRPITDKLLEKPALQEKSLQQLVRWQQAEEVAGPDRVGRYVDQLLATESKEVAPVKRRAAQLGTTAVVEQLQQRARTTLKSFRALSDKEREAVKLALHENDEAREMLQTLRNELDKLFET
jgi:ParB/RepB/Spo0J family partition protein